MTRPRHSSSPSERGCSRRAGRGSAVAVALGGACLWLALMGWPTILLAQQGDSLAEGGLALPVDTVDMVRELLDEQRRAFQQEFAEREAALQQTERDLVAKRGELSEAEFASQLAEFEAEVTQIQKEIQYRREAIDVAFQEAQTKLRDIAIQIVTELAQEKRLDVVLVRETALIFRPSLNLSAEVLRRLDERTKNARIEVTIGATGAAE